MNDMAIQDNHTSSFLVIRTADTIAAEINGIKAQTRSMMMTASIEIGRRLTEAKSLLDHGAWGEWLESRVAYSKSTANNLMRIFDEYGSRQITLLEDNASMPAYQRLGYTQAVALLGLPPEERDAFIEEHPIEEMSTRELQQAIRERDLARAEKDALEKELAKVTEAAAESNDTTTAEAEALQAARSEVKRIEQERLNAVALSVKKQAEIDVVKSNIETQKKLLDDNKEQANVLKKRIRELEAKPMDINPGATEEEITEIRSKLAADYEQRLADAEARSKAADARMKELQALADRKGNEAAMKFKAHFDTITSVFSLLLGALGEIKATDEEIYGRYRTAVLKLMEKMQERL